MHKWYVMMLVLQEWEELEKLAQCGQDAANPLSSQLQAYTKPSSSGSYGSAVLLHPVLVIV